jgi:undecaprenyl-diphosphatase
MIEKLDLIDKKLLLLINSNHNSFFDSLMYWVSGKEIWIPFYLILVYLIYRAFRSRTILVLVMVVLVVTAADQVASSIFKPAFKRYRPCREPELAGQVHTVKGCGGKYGFVSSHASNTFGVAMFLSLLFYKRNKRFLTLFIWASLVSFSRIYLGVHYPGDIVVGAIVGVIVGLLLFQLFLGLSSYLDKRQLLNKKESL